MLKVLSPSPQTSGQLALFVSSLFVKTWREKFPLCDERSLMSRYARSQIGHYYISWSTIPHYLPRGLFLAASLYFWGRIADSLIDEIEQFKITMTFATWSLILMRHQLLSHVIQSIYFCSLQRGSSNSTIPKGKQLASYIAG